MLFFPPLPAADTLFWTQLFYLLSSHRTLVSLPVGPTKQTWPIPQILHLRYNDFEFSFSQRSIIYRSYRDPWVSSYI